MAPWKSQESEALRFIANSVFIYPPASDGDIFQSLVKSAAQDVAALVALRIRLGEVQHSKQLTELSLSVFSSSRLPFSINQEKYSISGFPPSIFVSTTFKRKG